ncbi:MAG: class I SAM-dependent methyltransferase [Sphingosinicella sp.]
MTDYVLGTRDDEVERLGLQHRVWQSEMREGWRRAGFGAGQTVLDVGAGPGFATVELAEMVGTAGRVIALERSEHFLGVLRERTAKLAQVEVRRCDVAAERFGTGIADGSWCRWVLSFVTDPLFTIAAIAEALKPGGVAVFHEYADYRAWAMMPPDPDQERYRDLVMQSWRDAGGAADIARRLPEWLEPQFELVSVRPMIWIVGRGDFAWAWPAAFVASGAHRLAELGYVSGEEAGRLAGVLDRAPPTARMVTPLVAEIVARRR